MKRQAIRWGNSDTPNLKGNEPDGQAHFTAIGDRFFMDSVGKHGLRWVGGNFRFVDRSVQRPNPENLKIQLATYVKPRGDADYTGPFYAKDPRKAVIEQIEYDLWMETGAKWPTRAYTSESFATSMRLELWGRDLWLSIVDDAVLIREMYTNDMGSFIRRLEYVAGTLRWPSKSDVDAVENGRVPPGDPLTGTVLDRLRATWIHNGLDYTREQLDQLQQHISYLLPETWHLQHDQPRWKK